MRWGAIQIRGGSVPRNYRITHIFSAHVYLMPVTTAAAGHDAARPKRWSLAAIDKLVAQRKAVFGTIRLPSEMTAKIGKGSPEEKTVKEMSAQLKPLMLIFEKESNLGRTFTAEVKSAAEKISVPFATHRRHLLRYWYFGAIDQALLSLHRGPSLRVLPPRSRQESLESRRKEKEDPLSSRARSGRKPAHKPDIQLCEWNPSEVDVMDMERAAIRCAKKKKGTTIQALTDAYLRGEFKKRHAIHYDRFIRGITTVPCTPRMLSYRLKRKRTLDSSVAKAFPSLAKKPRERALRAVGSGHIYELDATGGQIYLVDSRDPTRILRRVTIYLLIDRFSRYVVSVYITLRPASSEGVRQALRIAFTSRKRRFGNLGIIIDDVDWPPGVVPLIIVVDNGPDMISLETLKLAVDDLKIGASILPPYTPDGKAIIERFIQTLKSKMRQQGLAGIYKKIRFSPEEKDAAKRAVFLAGMSLRQLYRELIEIVRLYNHHPHTGLKKWLPELAAAGLPFTPVAAYQYGLEHVSGLDRPPLTDEDLFQLTLGREKASIKDGVISTGRGLIYYPANEEAFALGAHYGSKRRAIEIKIGNTDPYEVYVTAPTTPLPKWELDENAHVILRSLSVEDQQEFAPERLEVANEASRQATIMRIQSEDQAEARHKGRSGGVVKAPGDPKIVRRRSAEESRELDAAMNGRRGSPPAFVKSKKPPPNKGADFRAREAARLEEIARRRSKGTVS